MIGEGVSMSCIPETCENHFHNSDTVPRITACPNATEYRSTSTGVFLCRSCAQAFWKKNKIQYQKAGLGFPYITLEEAIAAGQAWYRNDSREIAYQKRQME